MKLRARVGLASAGVVLVLVMAGASINRRLLEQAEEDKLIEYVADKMRMGGFERCQVSPEAFTERLSVDGVFQSGGPFGGRPPGLFGPPGFGNGPPRGAGASHLDVYAYGFDGKSKNPAAPPLDELLHGRVSRGQVLATKRERNDSGMLVSALLVMPDGSRDCALVLARLSRPSIPGMLQGLPIPPLRIWFFPALVVVLGVIITLGPVVRRIRQLTRQVRQSAHAGYLPGVTIGGNDELTELAQAFDEAGKTIRTQMEQQEKRERTLRVFLENTTHDVMIPLTVLSGQLEEMHRRIEAGDPISKTSVSGAMHEAHYMASLVHNLAVAAKLDAGQPDVAHEKVDLVTLVERVAARHESIAKRLDVSLDHAVPSDSVVVLGDVTLIEQAVSNLVHNAVRYNHRDGHVAVLLERVGGTRFSLRVIDDGPGIAEKDMARLFERNTRGEQARSRAPDGRGLGLDITRRVAELHGYELRFSRSTYGGLEVELAGAVPP